MGLAWLKTSALASLRVASTCLRMRSRPISWKKLSAPDIVR